MHVFIDLAIGPLILLGRRHDEVCDSSCSQATGRRGGSIYMTRAHFSPSAGLAVKAPPHTHESTPQLPRWGLVRGTIWRGHSGARAERSERAHSICRPDHRCPAARCSQEPGSGSRL